jgi:tRNA (mo5U34)-methyltransferase
MKELFDYSLLQQQLQETPLADWANDFPQLLAQNLSEKRYGDLPRWKAAYAELPALNFDEKALNVSRVRAGVESNLDNTACDSLRDVLRKFHPWRKGPFEIGGIHIDTEWRSDFKWDRVIDAIEPLSGRTVLDVGCGSGYHSWRMAGAGAELVIGIDPTPLFIMQYWVLQKYLQDPRVWVLPARMEEMPLTKAFDSVFSMGILYHRRSPFDHLQELRESLRPGGQLVLETLVIDGGANDVLVPEGRYSKMGNVWFIPSCDMLHTWLKKMRFTNIELVDVNTTSLEEQRSTEWMQFDSLATFLDPDDQSKTVEGYPAPKRAVFVANRAG